MNNKIGPHGAEFWSVSASEDVRQPGQAEQYIGRIQPHRLLLIVDPTHLLSGSHFRGPTLCNNNLAVIVCLLTNSSYHERYPASIALP